jgi:hypothetical protein
MIGGCKCRQSRAGVDPCLDLGYGSKKRVRYSGKARYCSDRKRWKAIMTGKSSASRSVYHSLSPAFPPNPNTIPQLLEAEVERPPPRAVVDDAPFGLNETLPPLPSSPAVAESPQSPTDAAPGSGPRPYMPRRRSSQTSLNSSSPMSPTSPVAPGGLLKPSLARRLSEATAGIVQGGAQ